MNEATASVTPPIEIEWGFVRARRSTGGRGEYLAFLHQMRAYWPKARPLVGEDPSVDSGHRQWTLLIGRIDDPPTQTYVATHVAILAFIPVAAMAAYRIHETTRGDPLFVAREPLPVWAKGLNIIVVAILVCAAVAAWRAWPW
jgi:hypothetical protein